MTGNFRWTPEALAAFEKRAESWRKNGTIRTHECHDTQSGPPELLRSKFGNKRTSVGQIVFASKKEARRWQSLTVLEAAGAIFNLDRQVSFRLEVNGEHICDYVADFVYQDKAQQFVEDCKGYRTEVYKLKKKLLKAIHGIEIRET